MTIDCEAVLQYLHTTGMTDEHILSMVHLIALILAPFLRGDVIARKTLLHPFHNLILLAAFTLCEKAVHLRRDVLHTIAVAVDQPVLAGHPQALIPVGRIMPVSYTPGTDHDSGLRFRAI